MTVAAERQTQTPARNILGRRERFDAVPFSCKIHYDFGVGSVGPAKRFDTAALNGSLEQRGCSVTCRLAGQKTAVAIMQGDILGRQADVDFKQVIAGEDRAEGQGARNRG